MAIDNDRPVMGGSFGGVTIHDGVEDARERIEWLKANAPDNAGAMADAEAQLARALERERTQ